MTATNNPTDNNMTPPSTNRLTTTLFPRSFDSTCSLSSSAADDERDELVDQVTMMKKLTVGTELTPSPSTVFQVYNMNAATCKQSELHPLQQCTLPRTTRPRPASASPAASSVNRDHLIQLIFPWQDDEADNVSDADETDSKSRPLQPQQSPLQRFQTLYPMNDDDEDEDQGTTPVIAGRRLNCLTTLPGDAPIDSTAVIHHSIVTAPYHNCSNNSCTPTTEKQSSCCCFIGAHSLVEYSILQSLSAQAPIQIGNYCYVSDFVGNGADKRDGIVLPDSMVLLKLTLPPYVQEAVLTVLGSSDDVHSLEQSSSSSSQQQQVFGRSLEDFFQFTGMTAEDLWSPTETIRTVYRAALHPVVTTESYMSLYAWLSAFVKNDPACSNNNISMTEEQIESLKRWKAATKLSLHTIRRKMNARMELELRHDLVTKLLPQQLQWHYQTLLHQPVVDVSYQLQYVVDLYQATGDFTQVLTALRTLDDAAQRHLQYQSYQQHQQQHQHHNHQQHHHINHNNNKGKCGSCRTATAFRMSSQLLQLLARVAPTGKEKDTPSEVPELVSTDEDDPEVSDHSSCDSSSDNSSTCKLPQTHQDRRRCVRRTHRNRTLVIRDRILLVCEPILEALQQQQQTASAAAAVDPDQFGMALDKFIGARDFFIQEHSVAAVFAVFSQLFEQLAVFYETSATTTSMQGMQQQPCSLPSSLPLRLTPTPGTLFHNGQVVVERSSDCDDLDEEDLSVGSSSEAGSSSSSSCGDFEQVPWDHPSTPLTQTVIN